MLSVRWPLPWFRAAIILILALATLVFHFLVLMLLALAKALISHPPAQHWLSRHLFAVPERWTTTMGWLYQLLLPTREWRVSLPEGLCRDRSYLIISNHQSWIDILLLFWAFNRRVPLLRFFMKQELRRVPIIGTAGWALEFPFMKRHSREAIARNPQLRFEDLETTRRFCERFRNQPITVVNFAEGTRFTHKKHRDRQSPYQHLLRPKSAGLAFTLNSMGDQFAGIIDVTIAYQASTRPPLLSFVLGEQRRLTLEVRLLPLPERLINGDYHEDPAFRERFQSWVNRLWRDKDSRLEQLKSGNRS